MKVLPLGISCAALVLLAACTTLNADGKRIDYGGAALQVPTLEVPPDLTTPTGDDRYKVPQGDGEALITTEGVATYSDYSKGAATKGHVASAVLPEVQGAHMERNNTQRWLVINDKAENVWPVVETFWQEIGLTIASADQAAGVMETAWAENHAKILPGGSHNGFNLEFSKEYTIGERDQYRTRLERSKDGASTEVYITHRGITEEFFATKGTSQWVARANDPELEAIMLRRLMMRFGVSETKAANAVAEVSQVPVAGAATVNTPEPVGTASLREISGGGTLIVMNDAFDRAWRKVGLAIEGAGLAVEDKDRDKGFYFLRPVRLESGWLDALKFWKSKEDTGKHYRVYVKNGGTSCEVSITDQDGASNKVSKQMLEAIYKNINQQ